MQHDVVWRALTIFEASQVVLVIPVAKDLLFVACIAATLAVHLSVTGVVRPPATGFTTPVVHFGI